MSTSTVVAEQYFAVRESLENAVISVDDSAIIGKEAQARS